MGRSNRIKLCFGTQKNLFCPYILTLPRKIKMNPNKNWFSKLKKQAYFKECFHQDENCSKKIIFSHSIQNNRILNKISHQGEVLCFEEVGDEELEFSLARTGRKKATTFTGFCGYHDNLLFKPIEEKSYRERDREQEFLFAYRALAKEFHAKNMSKNLTRAVLDDPNLGADREMLEVQLLGINSNLKQLTENKMLFRKSLENREFDVIESRLLKFQNEYHIAISSAFTMEKDFEGNIVNDYLESLQSGKNLKFFYLTVFPQHGKTYILFSYLKRYRKFMSPVVNQILKAEVPQRKIILSNLIAAHVENIVISPLRWENMPEKEQDSFKDLFKDTIQVVGDAMSNLNTLNIFV